MIECKTKFLNSGKMLIVFLVVLFGISLMESGCALAQTGSNQNIFDRFKKPMPELPLPSYEKFVEVSRPIAKKPYDEEVLAYSMRISKDWEEGVDKSSTNFILSEKLFLELSSYYSPPTISGRSRIVIEALNMEGNLTAEQWYIKYILEGGYTTEGLIVHNTNKVESLMVVMEGDYSYYLRSLAMINGDKIIVVKYYVPMHYFKDQAVMQAMVIASFQMTHPIKRKYSEMLPYRFLDIAEIRYPLGWNIYAKPVRNMDRLKVTILNTRKIGTAYNPTTKGTGTTTTEGKLDVTIISSTVKNTLVEEIEEYKGQIESEGMIIGERLPESYEFTYSDNIDFAVTEVYRGVDSSDNMSEYEFWYTVMVGGNYYYFITLLTPSRDDMFVVWAENIENYKLIVANFRPMIGAFLERN
ncbi:MAG: hypothetical protein KAJ29_02940 [Alphaproteobacteria bacterium]|nr:hypothetical protein [Alphaproteobacteria bacterium]